MVGSNLVFADPLAQMHRQTFRQPPRVDEHQRRAMLQRQLRQAVVDLAPHFVGGDRTQFRRGHFDRKIELAPMPDVDDRRHRPPCSSQEVRNRLDRLLRRRQSNARWLFRQPVEPLQRNRQMRAALVIGDGVNFIDDDSLDVVQDGAALVGGQQDVQRLGRGHQDVRRTTQHVAPLFHERVAGADGCPNLGHQQAALARQRRDLRQRPFQVLLDVVAQRLQRRHVEHFDTVVQIAGQRLAH